MGRTYKATITIWIMVTMSEFDPAVEVVSKELLMFKAR
jgi:hypothetical protein